ncbi:MAG: hypothetical protein LC808_00935 [Actinobacteria bacterium]|nr:hypothetical protein [Actinomycetota bacterium]
MNVPPPPEATFAKRQRVLVIASPFHGVTDTLIRPARLVLRRAWLVELDTAPRRFAVRRTRIVESALALSVEALDAVRGDRRAARLASAQFFFAVLVPLVGAAWFLAHPLVALAFTVLILRLLVAGFAIRR